MQHYIYICAIDVYLCNIIHIYIYICVCENAIDVYETYACIDVIHATKCYVFT